MKKKIQIIFYLMMSLILTLGQLVLPINVFAETNTNRKVSDDPGVILTVTNPIGSNGNVEIKTTLFGSAQKLTENGTVDVVIPKSIVASPDQLVSQLVYESPFYLTDTPYTEDGNGNYVLHVNYDASKIIATAALNQTFTIRFRATYFTDHSKVPENISFDTNLLIGNKTVSTANVSSKTVPSAIGQPSFLKYSDLPFEYQGNVKNYILDQSENTKNNIFILMVNYNRQSYDDVTIKDQLPKDTILYDTYPILTGITSGDPTPVKHLNIYKADQFNENGMPKHFTFVTSQFTDRISVTDNSLSVHLGKVTSDDAYIITYGLNVAKEITPSDFGTRYNNAEMQNAGVTINKSKVPVILKPKENDASILEKTVNKSQIATNVTSLQYTLKINSISGKIPAGTVITDPLPENTTFEKMITTDKNYFSDPTYDSVKKQVTFTVLKDIEKNQSVEISFSVLYDNPKAKIGDSIQNKASFNPSGTAIYSSTATTIVAGSASLVKTDKETGQFLPGAIFKVVDGNGNIIEENLTTNKNGIVQTGVLPSGSYSFIETQAPQGYELDPTPIPFTVTEDQTEPVKVSSVNQQITGAVTLTKIDKETKAVLPGAEFELQTSDGQVIQTNLVTNSSGVLTVSGLKVGDYKLVETRPPIGYELDSTPVNFSIDNDKNKDVHVTKTNQLIKGSIILTKVDKDNGKALSGAVFELQDAQGNVLQTGLTTNDLGKLEIKDLAPGDYQFVETKAPEGYEFDKTPVKFTIVVGKKEAVKVEKPNILAATNLKISKIDSNTKNPLSGSEFEIYSESDINNPLKFITTGSSAQYEVNTMGESTLRANGVDSSFTINRLEYGDYILKETKSPSGYKLGKDIYIHLDSNNSYYKVGENGENINLNKNESLNLYEINVENEKGIVLPETGGNGFIFQRNVAILILVISFFLIINLLINKKRRFN